MKNYIPVTLTDIDSCFDCHTKLVSRDDLEKAFGYRNHKHCGQNGNDIYCPDCGRDDFSGLLILTRS